ncbi:glutathione S-transferase [Synechococcus sp. PCC 7502]|uniref:glutathione S-transferase n=1 Tax=Synechococcus sp. PCC 7502 TaxID=1173263 RepID=UPI00029FB14D|nr:glutathione S-transferase [Synechococcus sp. PCC 7502]AFY74879.1 glutathione S-transferase [Synechococcus sp. PCC 7502]
MDRLPILYSFIRCPYAIRARMALKYAGVAYALIEVSLKNKPAEMLAISPKGTTPVLQLPDGRVLEESLDIMHWALTQNDPEGWQRFPSDLLELGQNLIRINDHEFKQNLDRYKYYVRFTEPQIVYRQQAETFLQTLEQLLQNHNFLLGDRTSLADIAIFPFIRQLAHVDLAWFEHSAYQALVRWLNFYKSSQLFLRVIEKSH